MKALVLFSFRKRGFYTMSELKAVILAAGKGTRMKSDLPKVLHEVCNKPMIKYVIDAAKEAGTKEICVVVGHKAQQVIDKIFDLGETHIQFVEQKQQLGTGHAVKCAKDFIGTEGETIVLFGDTPIVTGKTLNQLYEYHKKEQNAVTVMSAFMENPEGYGRIVRDEQGTFLKSVEHKDANEKELLVKEVNSGMYLFQNKYLSEALLHLNNDNAQGEYYLPDTLTIIKDQLGGKVDARMIEDATEIQGVNSKEQLALAEKIIQRRNGGK